MTSKKRATGNSCGARHYLKFVPYLMASDWSINDLAGETGTSRGAMYTAMYQLHAVGMVHISGRKGKAGAFTFRWGPGQDAHYREAAPIGPGAEMFCAMVTALQAGDVRRYSDAAGTCGRSLSNFISACRELRLVHISWWERCDGSGPTAAFYTWGQGRDLPKPKPMTNREKYLRHTAAKAQRGKQRVILQALNPGLFKEAA